MRPNQEHTHTCKLCNKRFLSGKVLGGHMRCHITKKSAKDEIKIEPINEIDMDTEGCERAGYGLRENPKKSWKFSVSTHEISQQEIGNLCKVCGRRFDSLRALFGHMKHHSGKRKKQECGNEFEPLRILGDHMRSQSERSKACEDESTNISAQKLFVDTQYSGEVSRLVRRKRSRRSRYKITPNSSHSNLSVSLNVTESELEIEVAYCMLMMSRGISNWDEFIFFRESSDNNSATFEVQSPSQSQQISDNDGDVSCKTKKPMLEKLSKSSEGDFGLVCDEKKMVEMELTTAMLCGGVTNKMSKLVFGNNSCSSEVMDDFVKRSEYKCKTCNKILYSHQSLGGHQTVHRTPKSSFQIGGNTTFIEVEEASSKIYKLEYSENSMDEGLVSTIYEFKEHKCSICFKDFPSGQALGCHKRSHFVKDTENEAEQMTIVKQELSSAPIGLDEANSDADGKINSWLVKNEHKLELVVGLDS